jgi:hypothetical protein
MGTIDLLYSRQLVQPKTSRLKTMYLSSPSLGEMLVVASCSLAPNVEILAALEP